MLEKKIINNNNISFSQLSQLNGAFLRRGSGPRKIALLPERIFTLPEEEFKMTNRFVTKISSKGKNSEEEKAANLALRYLIESKQ